MCTHEATDEAAVRGGHLVNRRASFDAIRSRFIDGHDGE